MSGAPAVAGRSRWAVLAAYVALVSTSHILWISFASVTDTAAKVFHTSSLSIGLLVSVGPICSAIFSIPGGAVPDRVGYRTPLLWAGLATAVFALVRPFAPNFGVLLLLTIAVLVPQPFLINAVADLVNRHFPEQEAATATGLGTMAIFLGITVGVALTPTLVTAVGIRGSQLCYAGLAVATLFAFYVVVPRHVPDRLRAPEELPIKVALGRVVRSSALWRLAVILFCGFGFYLGMTTWLSDILKVHNIGSSASGLIAGFITIGGMVGSVVLGALSDRIQRRKPFLVAAGLVSIPLLWVLGGLGSVGVLVAVAFVLGFFLLAALPVSIAMVSEERTLGPQVASTAVGVILMAGNLGGAIVTALMGVIKNIEGNYTGSIALAASLAVVAVGVAVTLREPLARLSAPAPVLVSPELVGSGFIGPELVTPEPLSSELRSTEQAIADQAS